MMRAFIAACLALAAVLGFAATAAAAPNRVEYKVLVFTKATGERHASTIAGAEAIKALGAAAPAPAHLGVPAEIERRAAGNPSLNVGVDYARNCSRGHRAATSSVRSTARGPRHAARPAPARSYVHVR